MRQIYYRVEEKTWSPGVDQFDNPLPGVLLEVVCTKYYVVKKTPKGAWVTRWPNESFQGSRHFILTSARKRFACPTKREAIASFYARKAKQKRILHSKLRRIHTAINLIDERIFGRKVYVQ